MTVFSIILRRLQNFFVFNMWNNKRIAWRICVGHGGNGGNGSKVIIYAVDPRLLVSFSLIEIEALIL